MDKLERLQIIKDLMGRINQDEISALIKELERRGTPVQVDIRMRLDTPDSVDEIDDDYRGFIRRPIGSFYDRPLQVTGVAGSDQKYAHDLARLEGQYSHSIELSLKIENLNVFYSYPEKGSTTEKTAEIIKRNWPGQERCYPLVARLQHPNQQVHRDGKRIDTQWPSIYEVSQLLDRESIAHLQHNIIVKPTGLYDVGSELCRSFFVNTGIKIADITLKLL